MIKIDDAAFTAAMRAAVAERGEDYVFPNEWKDGASQCRYVQPDGDGPACLIGVALHRLGVPLDALLDQEGCSASHVVGAVASGVTYAAARAANKAQEAQDIGATWGAALARYLTASGQPRRES